MLVKAFHDRLQGTARELSGRDARKNRDRNNSRAGVPRREDRHRHLVDGSKEIPEGDDSQVVSSTLGDRGVIQGHEDDPALRIHSRTVSANGQAGDRGPVARLQPHALCDGEGRKERDEIPIRNRQHIGGRQILPVSHSIRVPRRKIVRKSVLTAR